MMFYLYVRNWIDEMLSREEGQDLAEYALLLVLIAIVAIAAITLLGPQISSVFNKIVVALGGKAAS